jgi:protein SCO1/2
MKFIFLFLTILPGSLFAHEHHHGDMKALAPVDGASIYNLNENWNDQSGKPLKLKDFSGKKVVIVMVYLACKTACPILTADMKHIASQIPPASKDQVHFVLASIDPARDKVGDLKKFAERQKLGPEFSIITGSQNGVRALAATLGVQYVQDKKGDFQHSNLITLLDEQGVVKVQVQGLGADVSQLIHAI